MKKTDYFIFTPGSSHKLYKENLICILSYDMKNGALKSTLYKSDYIIED